MISMNGNAFAISCDPINGNPFAPGCAGNGQWTNPSPGVLCNSATGQCIHTRYFEAQMVILTEYVRYTNKIYQLYDKIWSLL